MYFKNVDPVMNETSAEVAFPPTSTVWPCALNITQHHGKVFSIAAVKGSSVFAPEIKRLFTFP